MPSHISTMCSRLVIAATCLAVAFAQYPGPLYSACSPAVPCSPGLACQASVCIPVQAAPPPPPPPMVPVAAPAPLLAPPAPLPMAAPVPVAPPLPVAPAPAPAPIIAAQPPMCAPACVGGAACIGGACSCGAPQIVYSPMVGCAPAPVPIAPVPVVAGRLIPQALPGAPCEPGVECTGGSVCSLGVCVCPPELVQEGTVCVARTIYGVVPPPVMPVPVTYLPVGAPCAAPLMAAPAPPPPPCVQGAVCAPQGVCACAPSYAPVQGACVRRK